jgi:hypothetical protein
LKIIRRIIKLFGRQNVIEENNATHCSREEKISEEVKDLLKIEIIGLKNLPDNIRITVMEVMEEDILTTEKRTGRLQTVINKLAKNGYGENITLEQIENFSDEELKRKFVRIVNEICRIYLSNSTVEGRKKAVDFVKVLKIIIPHPVM